MISTICTLFEGSYHCGVAALTNSLYKCGFRGVIYAGYRGSLPKWTEKAKQQAIGKWENALVLDVAEGLKLVFLPLTTDYHLTNYKPDFMLELLDGSAKDSDAIFYFDPDICVVEQWSFFEEWVQCGVALCENVWSPLPQFHPRRVGWREYYAEHGVKLTFKEPYYVNGGLVGVQSEHKAFLAQWQYLQELMKPAIGGLDKSMFKSNPLDKGKDTVAFYFSATDQDALNCTVEASELPVSILGKEAMGFSPGYMVAPHALGRPKPWEKQFLKSTLLGVASSAADTAFWNSVQNPINVFKPHYVAGKRLALRVSKAAQRVYRKS